jgi:hypothetical protein
VIHIQDELKSIEGQLVNITAFQAQALEVHEKLQVEQQNMLSKIEIVQNYFLGISHSLDNIAFKEKEATKGHTYFPKVVAFSAREEVPTIPKVTVEEQIGGDIILKTWETNIVESRKMAREVKKECEEVFDQLDTKTLGIGKGDCPGILGQINVIRHQLHIKESWNEAELEISQLKQLDITQMDNWLINPNLQLQSTKFEKGKIEDRLPKIQRKLYVFEAKNTTEPSKILVQFLDRCVKCFGLTEGSASNK